MIGFAHCSCGRCWELPFAEFGERRELPDSYHSPGGCGPLKDAIAIAYDRTLELLTRAKHENDTYTGKPTRRSWRVQDRYDVSGIYVQSTGLFYAGDVILGVYWNGQGERLRVGGYSSKKRALVGHLYQQYARYWYPEASGCKSKSAHRWRGQPLPEPVQHHNRTRLRLAPLAELTRAEVRDGLELARWAEPAVRDLAVSGLRAACAASSVGTSSGATDGKRETGHGGRQEGAS